MKAPGCAPIALTVLAVATGSATAGAVGPGLVRGAGAPRRFVARTTIAHGRYAFAAFAGRPAAIKLAWPPVADAARFHARWTGGGDADENDLSGSAIGFERSEAAPGHHTLSIVAIDAQGRASEPAEVAIDVVAITAIHAGSDAAADNIAASAPAFAIGSRFASPGLACRLGSGAAASEAVATAAGATTLTCGGEPGQPRVEVPLVIAPVLVDGPTQPIVREAPTRVHVTIASVAPLVTVISRSASGSNP